MNVLNQMAVMRNPGNMSDGDMLLMLLIFLVVSLIPYWKTILSAIFIAMSGGFKK